MQKVGIIGGSGFIGSHITKIFLDNNYEVKVSTTDITKQEKYQHLMALPGAENLYVSELNITDKATLREFISNCDIVIHAGTPFILDVQDPQTQLFDPTIKGTENFLEVVSSSPAVQKVIIVASVAAYNTNFPLPANGKNPVDQWDENTSPFTSAESHPYAQAKFFANQTVEKFIMNNPKLSVEITSVSPVFVVGNALSKRVDSTARGMQFLFKNKLAPNPFVQMMYDVDVAFAMVDVVDVANATFKAATTKDIHGRNYLLSSESYRVSDISRMLNQQPPEAEAMIVYKNDLATRELNLSFQKIKSTLNNYSN